VNPPDLPTLARSSILLIFVFAGVEAALVPSGEVKDPARTVPRGIVMAMGTITVIYASLQFVAQGYTNTQIGRRMRLSEGTVRTHLNHIYERLGVTSRTAAVTRMSTAGLE